MSEESMRSYPHRLYAHWNSGNMDAFYAMIDEEVMDVGGDSQGRSGVRKILDHVRQAFPDSQYTVEHVVVDGDWLVARLVFTGTQKGELFGWPATNKRATWKEIRYCRIKNDKTVEHHACIDNLTMLTQLGHIKPPAQTNW